MTRKTITVAEVGEIRTFGENGKALPIKGEDGLKYECYRPQLFEHLTVGATVECEVEEKPSKDGRFINHNIQGVFKDGQPVGAQKQQGGGRSYGKSPDERASIERQVAIKEIGEAMRANLATTLGATIDIPTDLRGAYWGTLRRWLQSGLPDAGDASLEKPLVPHTAGQEGASAPKPILPGIPQPKTALDEAEDMDKAFAGTVAGPRIFDSTLAFLNAAMKELGLTQAQIQTTLEIEKGADLFGHDLSAEWQKLVRVAHDEPF